MRGQMILSVFLVTLCCCAKRTEIHSQIPNQVGDTFFDKDLDDPHFKVCNPERVYQYYNFSKGLQYTGEKTTINNHFRTGFKPKERYSDSGFLTIRFIVNCEGKTGWFRVQGMDNAYHKKNFTPSLVDEILTLTKKLDGWIPGDIENTRVGYYQYLTFKFENGNLIEIMP
jgi:hypothetical protein